MSVVSTKEYPVLASMEPPEDISYYQAWLNLNDGLVYRLDGEWKPVNNGLTGSRVLDGKRLTFTNGILTGYEVA